MTYYGDDCYFLYDFTNNQRHDFTINTNNLLWHTPFEDMATMMLNNGDTLLVILYNYANNGFNDYHLISNSKFMNGTMVASSGSVNNSTIATSYFFAETYFDLNHKQHVLFASDNSFLQDRETDYINYDNGSYTYPFSSINCNFLVDSLGALHKYINNPLGDTIRLETSIDTTFIPVPFEDDSILWNRNTAHCVDHLNRNWVLRSNELYMFDGTNWLDINSNMMPFKINYPLTSFNHWYYRTFAEFATNKFVIGNKHFRPNHRTANGFYVFTYFPATVGIKAIEVSNVNLSVNHALSSILVNNAADVKFYELYDLNGKMINSNNNSNNSFGIDATGFQSGMYILKCVQKDNRVESIKFVW